MGGRRWVWLALWAGLGLLLIWVLLRSLSVSVGDVASSIAAMPFWVFVAVAALTLSNKVIGTLKWLAAARYLARPIEGQGFWRLVEMTNLGALFGQLIPVQLSVLLVRWFLLDRNARTSGQVIGATFFEQAFDLILVLGGTVAAIAVFVFGLPPNGALGTLVAVVGFTLVALRPLLRLGARVIRMGRAMSFLRQRLESAQAGFERAAAAPTSVLLTLAGYSLARLVVVALRAVVVMIAFAPETASWLVFIATPGISLLTALPITPAGLGVAEWSWSAILVSGGTPAAAAAIAALNLRLVTFAMMLVIAVVLGVLTRVIAGGARN